MRWSGAGAGLIVMGVVFIAAAVGMVFFFRIQPAVDRPPQPCDPAVPTLQGPEIRLSQFSFDGNRSAVLAIRAGARELDVRAVVLTWRRGTTWRWDGAHPLSPGGREVFRVGGAPLMSGACATGDITVIYALPGQGLVKATAQNIVQRVP